MIVSQTIVPRPSICAPSWILTASPSLSVTAASASSEVRGVYGVTKEEGETVVGCEMPGGESVACSTNSHPIVTYPWRPFFLCKPWQSRPPKACHPSRK